MIRDETEGDKPARQKFKSYSIGYFHLDIAEARTEEGKLYLFVAIDRTSKLASVGYEYPDLDINFFGTDYEPEPYIVAEYERARNHQSYMTSRMITVNDIYTFDPNAEVKLDELVDTIGRNSSSIKKDWDSTTRRHRICGAR